MEVKTLSSFVERIDTDEDTMEDFRESDSESIWELILAAEPGADGDNVFFAVYRRQNLPGRVGACSFSFLDLQTIQNIFAWILN